MNNVTQAVLLISATVLMSGCTTNHCLIAYKDSSAPSDKIVKIVAQQTGDHTFLTGLNEEISIYEIDGNGRWSWLNFNDIRLVYLLPGKHSLKVYYRHKGRSGDSGVYFDFLPGETYTIKAREKEIEAPGLWKWKNNEGVYEARFWMEDSEGNIVGNWINLLFSQFPPDYPPYLPPKSKRPTKRALISL